MNQYIFKQFHVFTKLKSVSYTFDLGTTLETNLEYINLIKKKKTNVNNKI